jgi:hypothetical protein
LLFPRVIPKLVAAVVGLALVASLARPPSRLRDKSGRPLLPNANLVKHVGKAALPLIVQLYWLRVINLSSTVRSPEDGRDVLGMAELIEELDPDYSQVYWFAALNGVVPRSENNWANAEEAADHLRRGLKRFPDEARMSIVLAYNLWRHQKKLAEAAEVLREGARQPNAPKYFASLATRLLVAAGEFQSSREVANEFFNVSMDPETRRLFEEREKAILLEEVLRPIEDAAKRFHEDKGRYPITVNELVFAGYLQALPNDPFGGELLLTPDGTAYSSAHPERFKVYERD